MASKGFCILAQNNDSVNYVELAVIAAKSIKLSQKENDSITLITDDPVSTEDKYLFDEIVGIPWMDHAENSEHKMENTWKYFWASPYDETIVVSPDMIIPSDLGYWWDILSEKEMWFPSNKKTFVGNDIKKTKMYVENGHIPYLFSNVFYFKKGEVSAEFFCMLEQVYNNWEYLYGQHLDDNRPMDNNMSLNYSLAAYLTGLDYSVTEETVTEIPTFVDIYDDITGKEWYNSLHVYMNRKNEFYISNYKQHFPVHYSKKEWLEINGIFDIYE